MPLTNYNPKHITLGSYPLNSWDNEVARRFDGFVSSVTFGLAKLTDTLQTAIPIVIPSNRKRQSELPDRPFTVPQGAIVTFAGFRLPGYAPTGQEDIYGLLPRGCTIVGTTGENLKLSPTSGTTHTVTAPVIAAASNAWTPNDSIAVARGYGTADAASPSLLTTLGSSTAYQITVSNAGNTAAGTGIRLSQAGAVAFIVVQIGWIADGTVARLEDIGYPIKPD